MPMLLQLTQLLLRHNELLPRLSQLRLHGLPSCRLSRDQLTLEQPALRMLPVPQHAEEHERGRRACARLEWRHPLEPKAIHKPE